MPERLAHISLAWELQTKTGTEKGQQVQQKFAEKCAEKGASIQD